MRKQRLIILGAGFSQPAGLPLASTLWSEIFKRGAAYSTQLRASRINDDIKNYIQFRRDTTGECTDVNFEKFMQFLDVEHYLGLRGGETWSQDGNEGTIVAKYLIGRILARYVNDIKVIPQLYIEFAKRLEPNDRVITFNYDTILERALDAVGKPYRLFPFRYDQVSELGGGTIGDDRGEVVVLKMHGSIDWFDRAGFERRIVGHAEMGAPAPEDIIFSDADRLGLEKLTDGPRPNTDPLKSIYRAKNLKALYDKDFLFMATPRILPPSATKLLYATKLNNFWEGANYDGHYNYGMSVIGFSLPEHDEYALQILYRLVKNYQGDKWDCDELGRKKSPLAIIDYFVDSAAEDAFRKRYRFVDWTRANLSGSGFNMASLENIFS